MRYLICTMYNEFSFFVLEMLPTSYQIVLSRQIYEYYELNHRFWYDFSLFLSMRFKIQWILLSMFLIACGDDDTITLDKPTINFHFKHLYKTNNIDIRTDNSLVYTNEAGNPWNIKSIKYYISKLIIYKDDSIAYDVNMVKLINPAESNTEYQEYILKDIPAGRYTKMSFIFGVDSTRNKFLGLGNTSEANSMEWPDPLGGGYHFMMMEGVYQNNNNVLSGYAIHLGKNNNQYYAEYPIDFTAKDGAKANINIIMNVDQWFDGINTIDLNDGYGYMMDDDAKQLLFKQNASSVFSIEQL